jgi:hypothetical protein
MFDIVTFCSENYGDALDFALPSWLTKANADKIVIYTDGKVGGKWKSAGKIEFREEYDPSDDWHVWALRKPDVVRKYIKSKKDDNVFLLTDLDCYALGSWKIKMNGWLGVMRWDKTIDDPSPKRAVSVFYGRVCENMKRFTNDWIGMTQELSQSHVHTPGTQGFDQVAFQIAVELYSKSYKGIFPVNENIYSSENDSLEKWEYLITKYRKKVKCLHFKGGRWRDQKLVDKMLGIVNGA